MEPYDSLNSSRWEIPYIILIIKYNLILLLQSLNLSSRQEITDGATKVVFTVHTIDYNEYQR